MCVSWTINCLILLMHGATMKLIFEYFSKICPENPSFVKNLTRITDTLHENQNTFLTIFRWILLRIKNISDKVVQKINTLIFILNTFFSENRVVYEILRKNIVQPDRPQTTIWRMRYARWIPKSTNTRSEYAIIIVFSLQQRLNERVSMLRYTYIVCLVYSTFIHYYRE